MPNSGSTSVVVVAAVGENLGEVEGEVVVVERIESLKGEDSRGESESSTAAAVAVVAVVVKGGKDRSSRRERKEVHQGRKRSDAEVVQREPNEPRGKGNVAVVGSGRTTRTFVLRVSSTVGGSERK